MSGKTCECEDPWWDTDLQGRDYPCRRCGGMVPNFPDMMKERSPIGRTGKPLVLMSGAWADLLQDGESFEIMEADGSRRRVKKEDVEIASIDFGEVEARAFVTGSANGDRYLIDPETYGVREYDEFRNRQLQERWAVKVNNGSHRKPRWVWIASFVGPERLVYDFIIRSNLPYGKSMRWESLDRDASSGFSVGPFDKSEFD